MSYNVQISQKAETQYENILDYVANTLKNEQAVISIMDDFDDAITTLESMADGFEYCRSNRLKKLGLRKLCLSYMN